MEQDPFPAIWPIHDGVFVQAVIPEAPLSQSGRDLIERVADAVNPESTLYLRGSCLEAEHPHPDADLDLVLVSDGDKYMREAQTISALCASMDRSIDLIPVRSTELRDSLPLRLLLAHRAIVVAGTPRRLESVSMSRALAREHWQLYAPLVVDDQLTGPIPLRVCMVKQLLRSVALIKLIRDHTFSRDLPTCAQWGAQLAPQIAPVFDALLDCLNDRSVIVDVRALKTWLAHTFAAAYAGPTAAPKAQS